MAKLKRRLSKLALGVAPRRRAQKLALQVALEHARMLLAPMLSFLAAQKLLSAERDLLCVELFCGVGSINGAMMASGIPAAGLDVPLARHPGMFP